MVCATVMTHVGIHGLQAVERVAIGDHTYVHENATSGGLIDVFGL